MIRCFWGIVVALMLSGCAVHPLPEDVTRQSTFAIVAAIRCEAQRAIGKYAPDPAFDQAAIGFIFDFTISEQNDASVMLSFHKVFPSGTFDLNLGPSSNLTRQAERKFTIVDTFKDLRQAKNCSLEATQANFPYPIAGAIGLDEVIRTAISIDSLGLEADTSLGSVGGQTAAFSDELTYTTKFDTGSIAPSVSPAPFPGVLRLASASASLQANRQDIHKLTLAIALPEPPKSTSKGDVRVQARKTPLAQTALLGSRGIPSKVLINGTANTKVRVLWELDRRVLLGQEDRLINALGAAVH
jgi:hypothetical protein